MWEIRNLRILKKNQYKNGCLRFNKQQGLTNSFDKLSLLETVTMEEYIKDFVREGVHSHQVQVLERVQSLWSGYGEILRIGLDKSQSAILKHIRFPDQQHHPRGWSSDLGHQRKVKSYQVEMKWYRDWAHLCTAECRVPKALAQKELNGEMCILLEDLDNSGYPIRKSHLNEDDFRACLSWLAHFHAKFLNVSPEGLWASGTYWHLETRPDELGVLEDKPLKKAASQIDQMLKECRYQTLVHGDAKVANFCFSENSDSVAAVDFQYVGGGCGMKDLAYFMGSCLSEQACESRESEILETYFSLLEKALGKYQKICDFVQLEESWRAMYDYAWTDFHRFLKGWSPGHWKINSYSEKVKNRVLSIIRTKSL